MLYVANLTAAMRESFAHMPYYNICSATSLLHLDVLFSCPDKCLCCVVPSSIHLSLLRTKYDACLYLGHKAMYMTGN